MMNLRELATKIRPHKLTARNVMFGDITPLREAADVIEKHDKLLEVSRRARSTGDYSELIEFLEHYDDK